MRKQQQQQINDSRRKAIGNVGDLKLRGIAV
jgi:hypothetical protein